MARPNANTTIEMEKRITREICQDVKLLSGLSYIELEQRLNIDDATSEKGSQSGRNFARYCNPDDTKGRAASRDMLAKIIKKSIEFGWLPKDYLSKKGKRLVAAIPLNPKTTAAELFKERQNEVDQLVDRLNTLRSEVKRTIALLEASPRGLKHLQITNIGYSSNDEFWTGLDRFVYEHGLDDPMTTNSEYCPPRTLSEALAYVELYLNVTGFEFPDGFEPMPLIKFAKPKQPKPKLTEAELKASVEVEQIIKDLESLNDVN